MAMRRPLPIISRNATITAVAPMQAQLLADDGEDEVVLGLGQATVAADAEPEAPPADAAVGHARTSPARSGSPGCRTSGSGAHGFEPVVDAGLDVGEEHPRHEGGQGEAARSRRRGRRPDRSRPTASR